MTVIVQVIDRLKDAAGIVDAKIACERLHCAEIEKNYRNVVCRKLFRQRRTKL